MSQVEAYGGSVPKEGWQGTNSGSKSKYAQFGGGIFQLAAFLGLKQENPFSPYSLWFCSPIKEQLNNDFNRLFRHLDIFEHYDIFAQHDGEKWIEPGYRVVKFIGHNFGQELDYNSSSFPFDPKLGNLFQRFKDSQIFRIQEVKTKSKLANDHYKAEVIVNEINPIFEKKFFYGIEELIQDYPNLDPDECIDWSQEKGSFYTQGRPFLEKINLSWEKTNDKYYLSNPLNFSELDYTSIILTKEAIKKKAWNLLGLYGYGYTSLFLIEFPDVRKVHTKAIQEKNLYDVAISNNLTNNEYMRRRLNLIYRPFNEELSDFVKTEMIIESSLKGHAEINPQLERLGLPLKEYNLYPKRHIGHDLPF